MCRLTDLNVTQLIAIASIQEGIGLCISNHVFIEGWNHSAGAETNGKGVGIDRQIVPFYIRWHAGQF